MPADPPSSPAASSPSRAALWIGRILSWLPALVLIAGGAFALTRSPQVLEGHRRFGFPESTIVPFAVIEILCAILYLVPQTAVFGALLLTAYFGGAVLVHVRIGDPFFLPIIFAVVLWLGLWLREPRLRALVPLRRL